MKQFGRVDALLKAAGVNTPQRSLAILSYTDFRRVTETNLYGAYFYAQAFLPGYPTLSGFSNGRRLRP